MFENQIRRGWLALACGLVCAPVWAAVPNDRWTDRIAIAALPYSIVQTDVGSALFNSDEPTAPCFPSLLNPGNAVWYAYTTGAEAEYVNIDTLGSSYDSVISVWTGTPGEFELVGGGCNDNGNQDGSANTARLAGLRLAPDTQYSILVSRATQGSGSYSLNLAIARAPLYRVTRSDDRAGMGCADGDCSLREAISAANAAPGAVLVPAGTYRVELAGAGEDANASGDFDLRAPMSLYGEGTAATIVDGNGLDRVFHLDPSGTGLTQGRLTAHFAELTIRGGQTAGFSSGAGLFSNSGGSFLSLERVAVRDNVSVANGGGIQAGMRGFLREVLVQDNSAVGNGGGISLSGSSSGWNFDVVASAVVGNRATGTGTSGTGGGINSTQLLRISNSTIDGNEASHSGGGINVDGSNGELALHGVTLTHNRSDAEANGVGSGGGLRFNGGKTSTIRHSVLAFNVDPTNPGAAIFGPDCSKNNTTTLAIGYSLVSDRRGTCSYTGSGNLLDADPGFDGQLGDHGGPTPTLLPLATSALVDAGDEAGCRDFLPAPRRFDQRGTGHARAIDGGSGVARCDIGAVEYEAPAVEPPAGVPALLAADDSGISSNDGITNVVAPRFTGRCLADATIHLWVDGVRADDGAACVDGRYVVAAAAALTDGPHPVQAQALVDGEWSEPTAPFTATIDTRAPGVRFTEAPPAGITADETQFRVDVDEAVPAVCSLDGAAPTACRDPHKLFLLGMGAHRFVAAATDLAGNPGSAEHVFERVELSPLEAPFLDVSADTGRSNTDGITLADPLRIVGTCRDGDLVTVYDIDEPMDASGRCSGGAFSIDVAGAREGLRIVAVTATRAGLETTRSPGAFVLVDRTPPPAPTLQLRAAGARLEVGGSAEANADVAVLAGTQPFCTARADAAGQWNCAGDLGGQDILTASASDVAGNLGVASAPLHVDLAPLAAPRLDPATDSGRSDTDGITRADPIRLGGTCRDGDTVKAYRGGVYTGVSAACAGGAYSLELAGIGEGEHAFAVGALRDGIETAAGPATSVRIDRTPPGAPSLRLPDAIDGPQFTVDGSAEADADVVVLAGAQPFCSARADGQGQWSCAGDFGGERALTASASDAAGNVGAPSAPVQVDWDRVFGDGFDG